MADKTFKVKNSIVIKGIELDPFGATPNQVLAYNGSKFIPTTLDTSFLTISDGQPSSPTEGDLWFNSSLGRLLVYYDATWVEISGPMGPTGPTGPDRLQVSSSAPATPNSGDMWFNATEARLYSYYDDYWVEISGEKGPIGPTGPAQLANVATSAPSSPQIGQLWYNTSNNTLNVYDGSTWNAV